MHESVLIRSTMVNSICIKLPRTSQQKRTSIHRHHIKISKIMIGSDRKMHSCGLSYLNLTVVVEPLNVIRMGMLPRGQAKLLDHRNIHQIVAATAIDDGMDTAVLDDEEHVEKVMALELVVLPDRGTQSSLHNQSPIVLGRSGTKNHISTIIIPCNVSCNNIIIFNIRSTNIPTIASGNVRPFAWAILLHMTKTFAPVSLNVYSVSAGWF